MLEEEKGSFGSICGRCGKSAKGSSDICPECASAAAPPTAGNSEDDLAVEDAEFEREQTASPIRFPAGILLGLVAGALAMGAWALMIKLTGFEIGYAAWGVGVVTGLAAAFGAGRGSPALGVFSGAIAAAAILGGQLVVVVMLIDGECCKIAENVYSKQIAFAKKATAAKTPEILRYVVAEWKTEEDQTPDPDSVSDEDIREFTEEDLPALERLAAGDPSKKQFVGNVSGILKSQISFFDVLKGSLSVFTALWLFLGVGSAYRIAAGGSIFGEQQERVRRRPLRRTRSPDSEPVNPDGPAGPGPAAG